MRFYETPALDIVELDASSSLLAGSTTQGDTNAGGISGEQGGDDDSNLFN